MISTTNSGSFKKLTSSLTRLRRGDQFKGIEALAKKGAQALDNATPVETGFTGDSWSYVIERDRRRVSISWTNTNKVDGVPVVILLQYGHGTGTGGYVAGRDFINPTIKPIFDEIANAVWKNTQKV